MKFPKFLRALRSPLSALTLFFSLITLGNMYGQQCGTSPEAYIPPTSAGNVVPVDGHVTLRLYIFILRDGLNDPSSGASETDVIRIFNQINEDYRPLGISFALACVTPLDYPEVYYKPTLSLTLGNAHNDGLNLYLSKNPDIISPTITWLGSSKLGGNIAWAMYQEAFSHVASHEIGHCLSLHHTFRGIPCTDEAHLAPATDEVADTNPDWQKYPILDCTTWETLAPCNGLPRPNPGTDVLFNIMSYAENECQSVFTPLQGTRIRENIAQTKQNMIVRAGNVTEDLTISGEDLYYNTDIVVNAPATLTFSACSLHFAAGKRIIVKAGAKLKLLNQSLVTNWPEGDCINTAGHWGGIILENNYPTSTAIAKVTINNSTVENANIALQYQIAGGRLPTVTSEKGVFRNNRYAIYFRANMPTQLLSFQFANTFKRCTFEWNEAYVGAQQREMVGLYNITSTSYFYGCIFRNKPLNPFDYLTTLPTTGLNSFNSNVRLDGYPIPNTIEEEDGLFSGFYYGLYSSNANISGITVTHVQNTLFTNNFYGLTLNSIRASVILHNTFQNVSDYFTGRFLQAMTLNYCTGYTVKDNEFNTENLSGTNVALPHIGLMVVSSGEEGNLIAENTFIGQRKGIIIGGVNSSADGSSGLHILCNEFENSAFEDIFINDSGKIASKQGNASKGAGNKFSSNAAVVNYKNAGPGSIIYYHTVLQDQEPNSVFQVTKIPIFFTQVTCALPDDGLSDNLTDIKAQFQALDAAYLLAQNTFTIKIDDGNTEELITRINNATASNSGTLYTKLMDIAPYLSLEAMQAVLIRTDLYTTQQLTDLLIANPDLLRENKFIEEIKAEMQVLTTTQWENIKSATSSSTDRTDEAATLSWAKLKRDMAVHAGLRILLADSVPDYESTREWLTYLNSFTANLNIADTWLAEGNTGAWQQTVESIGLSNLTEEQKAELEAYTAFHKLLLNAAENGRNLTQLTEEEVQLLNKLANLADGYSNSISANFLTAYYGFKKEIKEEDTTHDRSIKLPHNSANAGSSAFNILKVYPNPAEDVVTFELTDADIAPKTLEIYNIYGVKVAERSLFNKKYTLQSKSSGLSSGAYQYRLIQNGQLLQSGQFVIK